MSPFEPVQSSRIIILTFVSTLTDPNAGGLEHCAVQCDGADESLVSNLLCDPHDIWKLCPVQPAGGHPGGRILQSGGSSL